MSATPAAAAPQGRGTLGEFTPDPHQRENSYKKVQQSLSAQDRIALVITGAIGTMYAVYVFALILAGWMIWQSVSGKGAFDPFPFAFLLFLGNIVQLLLMPLIMVGQNLQNRHAEVRSDAEYKTVGKMFHDTEAVMKHLDLQDAELLRQTKLLTALVESLVPADQRAAILGGSGPATPGSAA
ncbi:MAG TPA: DUF1003 domain-containing protein [Candidatus Limnocylindrales bacterium]|jgi:uncharacterized membrane protein